MTSNRMREAAKTALDIASLLAKDPSMTAIEEAAAKGISRSTIAQAKIILEFGTASELSSALSAEIGLRTLADTIKKRMTPEQRKEFRNRNGARTEKFLNQLRAKADLWSTLGPALRTLAELPNANELVPMIRSNSSRIKSVDQYLGTAAKWMEEFANAWAAFKPSNNNSDAGNGDGDAGTQHPKSAA